jgi:ABC-type nitrate/sulfonate/bicarbonate transport system substrate-binding protein
MGKYVIQPHTRLPEWVAEERGYFADEGLDYEFQAAGFSSASVTTSAVRSADSVPVELRRGAFEDMSAVRSCDVSAACHWAVNAAATSGAGKMWGGAYSVTPCGVFVAPDSDYRRPEDLAGVDIAVGYHSGSHYATIQALEAFLPTERISLSFQGLPNDRVRRLLRGEVAAATVFGAQYYVVEQLGYRKLTDATFTVGFLVAETADPGETAKYFRALERAQRDIDLRQDQFLHYWTREMPEDIASLVDVRRFGPGERIVIAPYTKEMFDRTQEWLAAHGLLDREIPQPPAFADVVMTSVA